MHRSAIISMAAGTMSAVTMPETATLAWYHYHAAMPYLEDKMPELFRTESIRLEHEASNWRGFFLCSAFVIEAVKKGATKDE